MPEEKNEKYRFPGEDEMAALAEGGLRVLRKEEETKTYAEETPQ